MNMENNPNNNTKVLLITICPNCNKQFTRIDYYEGIIAGSALELCKECDPNRTIIAGDWGGNQNIC